MTLPSQNTPGADHAAEPEQWWNSLAFRTLVQSIGIDVLLAVCFVVYSATSAEHVDWRLMFVALARTAVHTLVSSVMRRLKPPAGLRR